jgi:GxxExxY protein
MDVEDNHEGHEAHEGTSARSWGIHIPSPLSTEAELAMSETIGAAIAVHRELGPGYLETIYRRAMCIEFEARRLAYEEERSVYVTYRGVQIPGQRVDLIVKGLIVVELKAVTHFDQVHKAQLISYLKTTGLRGGLLINFRVPVLRDGIRRIVL